MNRAGRGAPIDCPDEAVAAPGQGLDETRGICLVPQGFAQAFDRVIYSAVEVHEGVGGPDPLPQLFTRDRLAGSFEKKLKQLEGLVLQLDLHALLAQLSHAGVKFENPKVHNLAWCSDFLHDDQFKVALASLLDGPDPRILDQSESDPRSGLT